MQVQYKLSPHLVDTRKLTEIEQNNLFLWGFPKEVKEKIHHQLSITKFSLHLDDLYPMVDVLTVAKFSLTGSSYRSALPDPLSAQNQHGSAVYLHPYTPVYQLAIQLPIPPVSMSGSAPMKAEYGMTGWQDIVCAFCGTRSLCIPVRDLQAKPCCKLCDLQHGWKVIPLGGWQIPHIPGCKCIQACINQVEAENAAASQAIVAVSTSIPQESAEQSALDLLPHTPVRILSIAEPADATYKVSPSVEMSNPGFQPYLVKAWAAYQAAKHLNNNPTKGIMMPKVSWVNWIQSTFNKYVSYSIWSTKLTPAFWSTSNPFRNQLQHVLAQDSLPDLWTCIRISSHHPPFWLPFFVLRFSSILATNSINLHHSSAFQTANAQP